jgi:hypothetical protein
MDKAMKFRVPWKTGNLLTSWVIQIQYTVHSTNLGHRVHLHHTATHISGRRLGLSSSPTVWTGRLASVWVNHVNLSSAPWSLPSGAVELGSPWSHVGSYTLSLSGHQLCPLRALISHNPAPCCHGFPRYLCSYTLRSTPRDSLPFSSVLCPPHLDHFSPVFS